MKKIYYGMVGGSKRAFIGDVHRKAIAFDPRTALCAGCFSTDQDINQETGDMLLIDKSRVYINYQEMAEKESAREDGIRFVCITTPNHTHYDMAACFLLHGIHVVCEKPLCFTVEQAKQLCALAEERSLLFGVMYGYSGYTMVKVMREMIQTGKIGEVLSVQAEYPQEWLIDSLDEQSGETAKLASWRSDPAFAGVSNCMGDIGTHVEHMVRYVTGLSIKRVLATANYFGQALELNANVLVEYENGANGAYWCSQVAIGNHNGLSVRVYGREGALEWKQEQPDMLRYTQRGKPTQELVRAAGYLQEEAAGCSRVPSGHPEGIYVAFANVYRNFLDALTKKEAGEPEAQTMDFPNAADGLEGVRFFHAVVESAKADASWVNITG